MRVNFTFLLYLFLRLFFRHLESINNQIMRTKCPTDMKQTGLEMKKKKKKASIFQKTNFVLCPVLPGFASHIENISANFS